MSDISPTSPVAIRKDTEGVGVGKLVPLRSISKPRPPIPRVPTELLRQVFTYLPDSQLDRSRCLSLRSASLVCRHWESAASERFVVIRSPSARRNFMDSSRASASRKDRACLVRILDLRNRNWQPAAASFVRFVPRLSGLRALHTMWGSASPRLTYHGLDVNLDLLAAFLSSCSSLVLIAGRESGGEDDTLKSTRSFDLPSVGSSVGRLKFLPLLAEVRAHADVTFYNLLVQSLGAPLVELGSTGSIKWRHYGVDPPRFEADALPCLEVVEFHEGNFDSLSASLVKIRPPLSPIVLTNTLGGHTSTLPGFLHACPTIDHLELCTGNASPYAAIALLQDHPPLTVLLFSPIQFFGYGMDDRISSLVSASCGSEDRSSSSSISTTPATSTMTFSPESARLPRSSRSWARWATSTFKTTPPPHRIKFPSRIPRLCGLETRMSELAPCPTQRRSASEREGAETRGVPIPGGSS
ncbi:hypothetical protein BDK51DRAFT_50134 [Blyttiomyces helicus]|uniref:F-box domain-containing protein n=1 Tax=Blyttiomyces helicus TaxID=388810 RepID=A0A4V1IRG3_9FUNG|nr:hypothetical protein BDK51DRAFT_50134 [Blyttiomyces helicus]|eukprot:RKO89957.1 hypothetical protein BDK51DRAFT_50134 [Blyttiomyces helicus]